MPPADCLARFQGDAERNPLRSIQPPGANDDHYTVEDYVAFIKRAYPALAAIWSELMDEEVLHSVKRTPEGKVVDKMSDEIGKAIHDTVASYVLEDSKIRAPVLSFFALPDSSGYQASYMTEEQKAQVAEFIDTILNPYNREWIAQFRRNVPHARIVEIPQGHHYCFIKRGTRLRWMHGFGFNPHNCRIRSGMFKRRRTQQSRGERHGPGLLGYRRAWTYFVKDYDAEKPLRYATQTWLASKIRWYGWAPTIPRGAGFAGRIAPR
jgi:hypothetical protein